MANYICPACDANNTEAGRCILCQTKLGKPQKALAAATITTAICVVLWIAISVLTRWQHPVVAIAFGGAITMATGYYSGGRGIFYQLVASLFTLVGIVSADALTMLTTAHQDGLFDLATFTYADFHDEFTYRFLYDSSTTLFYSLAILCGFCIVR